ncbi:MAG TPA: hypothetical protein PKI33_15275 [Anaerolineales bacterium]|nr:hypothetical protein [Anaerolineales bacterium]
MSRKRKFILLFLITVIATTPIFARAKIKYFSAYGACQNRSMSIKGNKTWEYQNTTNRNLISTVSFSDGYNKLECDAIGVGPFWVVILTVSGCRGNTIEICPPNEDDYSID